MPPRVYATAASGQAAECPHHACFSGLETAHSSCGNCSGADAYDGDASGDAAHYATLWAKRLEDQQKDLVQLGDNYRRVLFRPVSNAIADKILGLLNLQPSPLGQQSPTSASPETPTLPLSGDFYNVRHGREKLQRLLLTLAKWHNNLGVNFAFARFCAILLEVVEHERPCFTLASQLYTSLVLDDYYMKPGECMQNELSPTGKDVACVWEELAKMWPISAEAIRRSRLHGRLAKLIGLWLESLLAAGHDPKQQPIENFLPLLDRVIFPLQYPGATGEEARCRLRYVVVCICGRHIAPVASDEAALEKRMEKLECCIPVDRLLLQMIDHKVTAKPGHAKLILSLRSSRRVLSRPPENPCGSNRDCVNLWCCLGGHSANSLSALGKVSSFEPIKMF